MLFLAHKRIRGWSGHSTILLLQHVNTGKIVVGSMKGLPTRGTKQQRHMLVMEGCNMQYYDMNRDIWS